MVVKACKNIEIYIWVINRIRKNDDRIVKDQVQISAKSINEKSISQFLTGKSCFFFVSSFSNRRFFAQKHCKNLVPLKFIDVGHPLRSICASSIVVFVQHVVNS